MESFRSFYYHFVCGICTVLLCVCVSLRLAQGAQYRPGNVPVRAWGAKKHVTAARTTVVTKQRKKLLYLPPSNVVVGCSTINDAAKLAEVFAAVGTDPVRSWFAYDLYWNNNNCNLYKYGLTLELNAAQASFTTKQNLHVKVFSGQEGEVTPATFQGTLYIVMMNHEVLANIFRCEHDVNEESGFDRIELCRPNI